MLGPLFEAFAELNVATERVVYEDDSIDDVRAQLVDLDGVLVWVNPIQDGANRRQLDGLLRDVSSTGVWVSAHPNVIARMGTKEVLFHTRSLGWGTDTDLYQSPQDLAEHLPERLRANTRSALASNPAIATLPMSTSPCGCTGQCIRGNCCNGVGPTEIGPHRATEWRAADWEPGRPSGVDGVEPSHRNNPIRKGA
jgi:hypothetical protein